MVAVHKVDMIAVRHALEHWMLAVQSQLVPAHMGNFERHFPKARGATSPEIQSRPS